MNVIPLIVFIFLGHSQMMWGSCPKETDTALINQHVFCFSKEKGMHHYYETQAVMHFLNEMAERYQGYRFCGVNGGTLSMETANYKPGHNRYDFVMAAIDSLKRNGAIFGGTVIELGFNEGADSNKAKQYQNELMRVIWELRYRTENLRLPILLQRYEINNLHGSSYMNNRYRDLMTEKVKSIICFSDYISLYPIREVEKEMYIPGDHHYTCAGNRFVMKDAAAIYQIEGYDSLWRIRWVK